MANRADQPSDNFSPPPSTAGATQSETDWPAGATDAIVRLVDTVANKTTGPALIVARAIVYGLFAALLGLVALLLFVIVAVRSLNVYLPDALFGTEHVWVAYLLLGLVFLASGLFLWDKRNPTSGHP